MSFRKTVNPIWSQQYVQNCLQQVAQSAGTPGDLQHATVDLLLAGPPLTPDTNFPGTFSPATFAGYSTGSISGSLVNYNYPNGNGQAVLQNLLFQCTAAPAPAQSIIGYVVYSGQSGLVIAAEYFDHPAGITKAGDFVLLKCLLGFPWKAPIS